MQKQKELTFYSISRHVVKSVVVAVFQERACFVPTPFRFCDNIIVNCIQMILNRGAALLGTSFQSLCEDKM